MAFVIPVVEHWLEIAKWVHHKGSHTTDTVMEKHLTRHGFMLWSPVYNFYIKC